LRHLTRSFLFLSALIDLTILESYIHSLVMSTPTSKRPRCSSNSDPPPRRRSSRGHSSTTELAKDICFYRKRVVFITGAGISVASGVRPFRGSSGVWTHTIWTNATREAFRKDPLEWYNEFWLPNLSLPKDAQPNAAHHALNDLLTNYPNLTMITQNVDGLHNYNAPNKRIIEAHGRLGLFKCMPDEDSDTDSDSDDDDERLVHLGHRRKRRLATTKKSCPYQQVESLSVDQVEPAHILETLEKGEGRIAEAPQCPSCRNPLAPQALLFDEGYHSHDFYQFQRMEEWMANAQIIVFVGTSFAVRLPEIALEHARAQSIPVYNFNTQDMLESTVRLNATNLRGPSEEMLPRLLQEVKELQSEMEIETSAKESATETATRSAGNPIPVKS
jgi:NAD-dependent deacetylase